MKAVPHYHPGQVEACWNRFCVRITTSEQVAAVLGAGLIGAILGAILTRGAKGALGGAIIGGLLGAGAAGLGGEQGRPSG